MKLCLTCRKLSTGGSHFCAGCGHSFGAALCRRGHPNAPGTQFCRLCGSSELSLPTRYLPLAWVPWLLLGTLLAFAFWKMASALPDPAQWANRLVNFVIVWGFLLFLLSLFTPAFIKRAVVRIIAFLLRGIFR